MIGCLRTCVRKQPITALYFESETVLKFYNLRPGIHKAASNRTDSIIIKTNVNHK